MGSEQAERKKGWEDESDRNDGVREKRRKETEEWEEQSGGGEIEQRENGMEKLGSEEVKAKGREEERTKGEN